MNRRDILRGLGALPLAAACPTFGKIRPESSIESNAKIQYVQVLLEGAFTLVLERNPNRITAFVPKHPKISHRVYFNDPAKPLKEGSHHFKLSQEGLRSYSESYINPGFHDFEAHTDVWNRREELITIELPFPDSINFSGRPLKVEFKDDHRKGSMPTSHILEYYTTEAGRPKLSCPELGGECSSIPNCPTGISRYYVGVAPGEEHFAPDHAKDFFNFILEQFPKLVRRYSLHEIEPGPLSHERDKDKRGAGVRDEIGRAAIQPAVYNSTVEAPRLLRVSELIDCQVIGMIIHRP
jgi:hypothetical protein